MYTTDCWWKGWGIRLEEMGRVIIYLIVPSRYHSCRRSDMPPLRICMLANVFIVLLRMRIYEQMMLGNSLCQAQTHTKSYSKFVKDMSCMMCRRISAWYSDT